MSAPISARATSSTPSWSWCSAASAISSAPWSVRPRSASSTSSSNPMPAPCWARSWCWCSSSCSSSAGRAGCSRSKGAPSNEEGRMIPRFLWQGMVPSLRAAVLFVLAIGIILPLRNQLMPAGSALHVPAWVLQLIGKYLCFASLALAVDLVWGFCGILTLGHAAFFALGGYCMGMYLMRQIGTRGVYGTPLLPDFMVFLNYKELPWFWWGFDHFAYAALMIMLVPGVFAFVFGWLAFRSRVTGVYLSIITQAMTYALWLAFFRNDMGFGGNNGMTDFKDLLGFNLQLPGTRLGLYIASAVGLVSAYLLCRFITTSKLGLVL